MARHDVLDLILLDVMMPGLDGYETCKPVRRHDTFRHTKIVLVSAKAMEADQQRGLEAGAYDDITRPFDPGEFRETVRGLSES